MRLTYIGLTCAVLLTSAEAIKCWSTTTEDGGQVEVDCNTKARWSASYDQCFVIKRKRHSQTVKGCYDGSHVGGKCTRGNVHTLAQMQADNLNWVATVGAKADWEPPICCSGDKCNDDYLSSRNATASSSPREQRHKTKQHSVI